MPGSHPVRWIILLCGALAAFGCANTDTNQGATGSLSLDLVLAGGIEIDVVDWAITGNGMDMDGSIDVSASGSTASVEVYGLPVGKEPYVVELSAVSVDEEVTCRGSAEFDVEVGVPTPVMVILNCKLPQELGGVRVNGKFNICAQLTKVVVSPLQTSVGNDISLFSAAQDEEGDPIAFLWSSHSGSIADPTAASTTYTCTEVGDDDITVLVSDDGGSYCMSMWTVPVTCVAGEAECQSDEDCEAGEICVAGQCVPDVECITPADCDDENDCTADICADGTCSNPNMDPDESCNQDGGSFCDGQGSCVECNVDLQCDMGEVCVGNTCVPEVECVMDSDCDDENQCTVDTCTAGECSNPNQEPGATCDQDGGSVCDGQGNCVECNDDTQCDTGELCVANTCVGDPELFCNENLCLINDTARAECVEAFLVCIAAEPLNEEECILLGLAECSGECIVDGDCPDTGNECTDPVCNAGTCETSDNTNACDGGAGTCSAGTCEPNAEVVYEQNFNLLDINSPTIGDGWLFFANVFDSGGNFKFPYSGPAPNGTGHISAIVDDQGGAPQEPQQLSVFSDYACCGTSEGHFGTDLVEINVFEERTITIDEVGETLVFTFDAKGGNIEPPTTALAFIQTLDPNAGFSQSAVDTVDTTNISKTDWGSFTLSINIPNNTFVGHILQFGFRNTASGFAGSAVFYDNTVVTKSPTP